MNAGADRACPMCRSSESRLRRRVQREREFHIVDCVRCGFTFVRDPSGATFRSSDSKPAQVPVKDRHYQIKRVCDAVLDAASGSGARNRIVEVGAGFGGLAKVFSQDPRYDYVGFEPSETRAAYARSHGYNVRNELFHGPESSGPADAVVIDNVLEHLEDPVGCARSAAATLNPGGALIIVVPNRGDVRQLSPAWRDRHHWQPRSHINYFTAQHLDRLYAECGLRSRYFGVSVLKGLGDLGKLPRVLGDAIGIHLFGLNCYGIRPR